MLYRKLLLATAAVCMFGASAYAGNGISITQLGVFNSASTSQAGFTANSLSALQVGNQNGVAFTQVGLVNGASTSQYGFGPGANNSASGLQIGILNGYIGMQCTNSAC